MWNKILDQNLQGLGLGTGANEPFEISQTVSQEKENMNKGVGKIEGEKTCAFVEIGWFVS